MAPFLFIDIRVLSAMLLIKVQLTAIIFTRAAEHMDASNLTRKRLKM